MQPTVRIFPLALLALSFFHFPRLIAQQTDSLPRREIAVDLMSLKDFNGLSVLYRKAKSPKTTLRYGAMVRGWYRNEYSLSRPNLPYVWADVSAAASIGFQKNRIKNRFTYYWGVDAGVAYDYALSRQTFAASTGTGQDTYTGIMQDKSAQHTVSLCVRPFAGATFAINGHFSLGIEAGLPISAGWLNQFNKSYVTMERASNPSDFYTTDTRSHYSDPVGDVRGPGLALWLGVRLN